MSDKIELTAEPRADMGKGASRRLRKTGMVPAIIYGGKSDPVSVSLKHNEFIHQLENEAIYTQVLGLKVGSQRKENVILRDLQRHPFKNMVVHADFQRVSMDEVLTISVPLHFINEDQCHGVKNEGGQISRLVNEVEVAAKAKNIPEAIEIDVAELKLGEMLHLSNIKLPAGVEIPELAHGEEHDIGVVSVHSVHVAQEPEEGAADSVVETAPEGDDKASAED
jgi:large subunit ribosomal protein L25